MYGTPTAREAIRVILKTAAWAGLVALVFSRMSVAAGVVTWATIVLPVVWYYVGQWKRLSDAVIMAGSFALGGTGFSGLMFLMSGHVGVWVVLQVCAVLMSLLVLATWDGGGDTDLGGPTD